MTDQELLQQCKDEVAKKYGIENGLDITKWDHFMEHFASRSIQNYLSDKAAALAIQKAREEAAPNITTGQKEILRTAVDKWGNKQIDMVVEECSELIMAICKWKRYPERVQNVVEEIADVQIMLIQATMIFSSTEFVQKVIDSKIERVANRLKN